MEKAKSQPSSTNLKLIETEPWTPPSEPSFEVGLKEFARQAWRILEPAEPFLDNWHLDLFAEHAEAITYGTLPERNMLVNTPPGTTKSLFWSVLWPSWEWSGMPWIRWLTTSYDDGLALRDAVKTRRLMQTQWYQQLKTIEWDFVGDQNVKSNYVNDRTGWRIAASIQGEITGNHAHRVLVDDPHHVKKAESDAVRMATNDLWRETFPSRVLPSGYRIVVGQRTHEEDLSAEWLKLEGPRIHHIELKMEYETPDPRAEDLAAEAPSRDCTVTGDAHDPRTRDGDLLNPQRFPRAVVEARKIELGPYAYAGQYQQTPTPRAGALLNPAWFPQTPALERSTLDLVAAFDLNYSDAETSDWTIGHLGAVDRDPVLPMIHVVDRFAGHLSEEHHAQAITDWLLLWRPILVGIEKKAFEKQGATRDLIRQIMALCEEKGYSPNIEPIEADTDKITRAMIIPGRARAGRITFDRRRSWWTDVSKQMSQFPRSAHDDDIDALAHLVRLVVEKLQKLRAQQGLLGKSATVAISEIHITTDSDRMRATLAGLR